MARNLIGIAVSLTCLATALTLPSCAARRADGRAAVSLTSASSVEVDEGAALDPDRRRKSAAHVFPGRLKVGQQALNLRVRVRIPSLAAISPIAAPSSRGLGRRPLKAETGIRIPLGLPQQNEPDRSPSRLPGGLCFVPSLYRAFTAGSRR